MDNREQILQTVTSHCQDVPSDILHDFISRMDQKYFRRVDPTAIARHIHLAAQLTPDHLCELSITEQQDGRVDVTIVAYDYFAEFATICGLLSAFGLNIEEGQIYTFAEAASAKPAKASYSESPRRRPQRQPGLSSKKIVDIFRVQPVHGASFGPAEQNRLAQELRSVIGLLDTNQFEEARHAVNRRLVEQLGRRRGSFSGLLHPVQITFDNSQSPTDTIMDIRSDDTPAFLSAFANALATPTDTVQLADIANARMLLNKQNVPMEDRFMVISPDQEYAMLQIGNFIQAERYGSSEAHLNGEIGKVFGFKVLVHNSLSAADALFYHKMHVGFAMQQNPEFKTDENLKGVKKEYLLHALYGQKVLQAGKAGVYYNGAGA